MATHVVVVEDDQSVREMLAAVLRSEGYEVDAFEDAESMTASDAVDTHALVVLDVGLPGADGLELCARLRAGGHAGGILMLTARHEVADRVLGLDAGANDYLVKPFALDELLARIRALVRNSSSGGGSTADAELTLGGLVVDVPSRVVTVGGESVELTRMEFDLLVLLVANSPVVLRREVIHDRIWGYDAEHGSNTLEVLVSQLRRKLEVNGSERLLHTVRGVGYVARPSP